MATDQSTIAVDANAVLNQLMGQVNNSLAGIQSLTQQNGLLVQTVQQVTTQLQQQQQPSKFKASSLKEFTLDEKKECDVELWLDGCESEFEMYESNHKTKLAEEQKVRAAGTRLNGAALAEWWKDNRANLVQPGGTVGIWENFTQKLVARVHPEDRAQKAFETLSNENYMRQLDLGAREYGDWFKRTIRPLKTTDKKSQFKWFFSGLRERIRKRMMDHMRDNIYNNPEYPDIDSLCKAIIDVENRQRAVDGQITMTDGGSNSTNSTTTASTSSAGNTGPVPMEISHMSTEAKIPTQNRYDALQPHREEEEEEYEFNRLTGGYRGSFRRGRGNYGSHRGGRRGGGFDYNYSDNSNNNGRGGWRGGRGGRGGRDKQQQLRGEYDNTNGENGSGSECWNCGKLGHQKWECRSRPQSKNF